MARERDRPRWHRETRGDVGTDVGDDGGDDGGNEVDGDGSGRNCGDRTTGDSGAERVVEPFRHCITI